MKDTELLAIANQLKVARENGSIAAMGDWAYQHGSKLIEAVPSEVEQRMLAKWRDTVVATPEAQPPESP